MKIRINLFILFTLALCFVLSLHAWAGESYTVEFTYGDNQYVLGGGESVPLAEILDALGLNGEVTAVSVSDPELFSASDDGGDWIVSSHKPFSSTERMTVTLGGDEYGITVTDAEGELHYINSSGKEDYWGYWWHLESKDDDRESFRLYNLSVQNRYAVHTDESVTFDRRIDVRGDVELVLCDGCTLTINGGIHVGPDSSLTIYCQKGGTGKLIIPKAASSAAGIGGNNKENCGTVNIYGGNVEITAASSGAGIGGGYEGSGGNINIHGGIVKAVSQFMSTGIGGGLRGSGGRIYISGGTVTATGSSNSAGIGGCSEDGGEINICGGTVTANGGGSGAGIGGGNGASGGKIIISGGTVNATGGSGGAGIGGGIRGSGGKITISGGTVTAKGIDSGAGIGSGLDGTGGEITISGGTVKANGGPSDSAGIGGGFLGGGGTINISGGNITATGYFDAAGIGGGKKGNGADVTITGGTVTVIGRGYGQAIGHGYNNNESGNLLLGDETKGKYIRVGRVTGKGSNEKVDWVDSMKRELTCRSDDGTTVRVERCSPHKYDGSGKCIYCGAPRNPDPANFVQFTDAKGIEQYEEYCEFVSSGLNGWNDSGSSHGWYAVKSNVTVSSRITVSGDVNLILCDGVSLTIPKGIQVSGQNSLTIWAQSAGPEYVGMMFIQQTEEHNAGIGGDQGESCGTVTINGGIIVSQGGDYGAGIGGGDEGGGGTVIINGGYVAADGSNGSAGIGGGDYGNGGTVVITGGEVTAKGSTRSSTGQASPGIGSGRPRADGSAPLRSGSVTITGGTVTAISGTNSGTGKPAQAIGVNLDDAGINGTDYLILGNVAAYAEYLASEPVEASKRSDACRSGFVILKTCTHKYETNKCVYCGADVICGDVNLDGSVTPLDAMILARYLAGWKGYTVNAYAADIDRDGNVTVRDAIILARHIAGWDGYGTLPYKAN